MNLISLERLKKALESFYDRISGIFATKSEMTTGLNKKANGTHGHDNATVTANGYMSANDKSKLDGIANNANNYSHPSSHAATMITEDSTHRFVTDTEKSTWNAKASTSVATTSANGLMSSSDKTKLDGIAEGAQVNADITKAEIEAKLTGAISTHTHSYLPISGGSLTGNIQPNTAVSRNCGSAALPWGNVFNRYYNIYGEANKSYGNLYAATIGTTTTTGETKLVLGNSTATGTASNARGTIYLHGTNTGYTLLTPGNNTTSNITLTLPSSTGTLALSGHTHSYLPLSGGTLSGVLTLSKGSRVHTVTAGSGATGYGKIAQIKITANYQNQPIYFQIAQRQKRISTLEIRFTSANNSDPTLDKFYRTGDINAYMHKSATSTWDLYIQKTEAYDRIEVLDYRIGAYMAGVNVTWTDVNVSALPSGNVAATDSNYLPLSGGTLTNKLTINYTTGPRVELNDGTNTMWLGMNVDSSKMGIYDSTAGSYILAKDTATGIISLSNSTIDTSGNFSGNATSSSKLKVSRIAGSSNSANYAPGANTLVVREYANDCTNMPSAHYYHIYTGQGSDDKYQTQLAVGMTTDALCFRNRSASTWGSWKKVALDGHIHDYLPVKGTETIAKTTDDTTTKWGAQGNSVHWYASTGHLIDQPSQYGYILNIGKNSEVHQLWMTQSSGAIWHRGGNGSGWSGTWRAMLDSNNYQQYVGSYSSLLTTNKSNLVAAINEVFQSGNNAKQKLVDALVAKGQSCSTSNNWDTLIGKIGNIEPHVIFEAGFKNGYSMINYSTYVTSNVLGINLRTGTTSRAAYTSISPLIDFSKYKRLSILIYKNNATGSANYWYIATGSSAVSGLEKDGDAVKQRIGTIISETTVNYNSGNDCHVINVDLSNVNTTSYLQIARVSPVSEERTATVIRIALS